MAWLAGGGAGAEEVKGSKGYLVVLSARAGTTGGSGAPVREERRGLARELQWVKGRPFWGLARAEEGRRGDLHGELAAMAPAAPVRGRGGTGARLWELGA